MSWNNLRKGRFSQEGGEYFITFTTFQRQELFNDFELAKIFCQQIARNEQACNCCWSTWVLMPDHFHGLLRLESPNTDLSTAVGKLKGASAYLINKYKKQSGKVWQPAFYDKAVLHEASRIEIARYIVANPLRAKLTQTIKNYPFWDSEFL